jgi:chemotaxis protein CheD
MLEVRLKPGDLVVCREPRQIVTILGSCIAVTMFNARLGLAAMCHAMLPAPNFQHSADEAAMPFKFVSTAVPAMAAEFRRAHIQPHEVEVKIFGGANVIAGSAASGRIGIGYANVHHARQLILEEGFQIKAANVGGLRGRKIIFHTQSGRVLHKHLSQ